jgi:hypothetical protein
LHLVEINGGAFGLTRRGRLIAGTFAAILWLINAKLE